MSKIGKARSLRRHQTSPEKILWKKLRDRKLENMKFRRQVPIENFVADFCCFEEKLIIEVDGWVHLLKDRQDRLREQQLKRMGFRILRFSNQQVQENMDSVLETIRNIKSPSPSMGEG